MIVSCKRLLGHYEDLLEPLQKRYRLDANVEDTNAYTCGVAASSGERRRQFLEDDASGSGWRAEKRLRVGSHEYFAPTESSSSGAHSPDPASQGRDAREAREAAAHTWAEDIVKALQGCPSVEEATQRCARSLVDFEAEVRQAAAGSAEEPEGAESVQSLKHTNKVLMRAVHHLAERCRRIEASAAESDELRQALEQSQETQRRLQHSNEVLQGHLKVALDCSH